MGLLLSVCVAISKTEKPTNGQTPTLLFFAFLLSLVIILKGKSGSVFVCLCGWVYVEVLRYPHSKKEVDDFAYSVAIPGSNKQEESRERV